MGSTTVITSDGEEHDLFACDVCEQAPTLRLLEDHPDHQSVDDIFKPHGMLKEYYLRPGEVYHPLSFGDQKDERWVLCDKCRNWAEAMLDGGLLSKMLSQREITNGE